MRLTPFFTPSMRSGYVEPDYLTMHNELKQKGMTKQLLWEEYKQINGDQIFPDTLMTVATIDRIIHHATILEIDGDSYRRKYQKKA